MSVWQLDYFYKALEAKGWQIELSEEYDPEIPSFIMLQRSTRTAPLYIDCIDAGYPCYSPSYYCCYVRGYYSHFRIEFFVPANPHKYKANWKYNVGIFIQNLNLLVKKIADGSIEIGREEE